MTEQSDYDVEALKERIKNTPIGKTFHYPRKYQTRVHAVAIRQGMTVETRLRANSTHEIIVKRTS